MKSEPQLDALPADVSPTLRTYLARCLKKDPKERVRDIGDVRLALEGAFEISAPASDPPTSKARTPQWIAAVVVTGLIAGLAVWGLTRRSAPRVARLTVSTLPSTAPLVAGLFRDLAISPDGEWLVYRGVGRALHVRHIDRFETTRLDLVNAYSPFVSPDGTWIGFQAADALQKVPVLGGPPTTICKIEGSFRGASWGGDGTIVFATSRTGLLQVPAGGGEPRQLDEARRRQRSRPPVAGDAPGQRGGALCDRQRRIGRHRFRHRRVVARDRRAPRADSWRHISPLRPDWASRLRRYWCVNGRSVRRRTTGNDGRRRARAFRRVSEIHRSRELRRVGQRRFDLPAGRPGGRQPELGLGGSSRARRTAFGSSRDPIRVLPSLPTETASSPASAIQRAPGTSGFTT